MFTKAENTFGVGDELFCNIDYSGLNELKYMDITIQATIYFKDSFMPLKLQCAKNYKTLTNQGEQQCPNLYVYYKDYQISQDI